MASYIITYDLSKPDRDYHGLYKRIKGISSVWAHISESSWLVVGDNLTSVFIRDTLTPNIDSNDKLFVARLTGEAAWRGLSQKQTDWIKTNL